MSLAALLGQTASVYVRSQSVSEDEYGSPLLTEATPVNYACRLEQGVSVEQSVNGDVVITTERVYLPPTAVVAHLDRITIEGTTYEVVGDPSVQRSPRGPHHIVAELTRVTAE